ncbi:MAG: bifunctional 5,10-methylene-tetrahydrofolate dehydrogenase/5,10-methylene-tetrahydrofolate cyclohydrolase [Candidatus Handelsmanbacteria bacterium RIFCSPLOWO2_12_FULL_64_10]|uniref:Bifunctional protein FolD n=1 Tax=Handelsmanbacteria sp. (strain RIFCSPLOWO2_12_FULL_64_10) TaxID=1817868 RepID=A0A1F6CWQ9_HANXR|nr:MAG: bifunctional 5,10-methylene-tetrahydrofolate dehydrogenase/5,10-methylene-tetrahydrofolate cyclohydrolase [Candidatus Handelsmanbacteria bacterium RIFCSPLOWO2_12_FULL_64_10]
MEAKILDGNRVAEAMRAEMKAEIARLKRDHDLAPGLAVVLVGDNPASLSYVKGKRKACDEVGIHSVEHKFDASLPEGDLLGLIDRLNADPKVHGILVQLPLPGHIDEQKVLLAVHPDKDVDGFHPVNVGKMVIGEECYLPCTPHGIQQILLRSGIQVEGKHVVVVGRSNIVGKPIANILLQKKKGANATVTICHTGTKDMAYFTRQADILIVAAGRPNTVTAEMVREGAVVVDVGVNRVPDASKKSGFRLVGDVDFEGVGKKASAITPVPGGVGPMTITLLLHNTIQSAKRHHGLPS